MYSNHTERKKLRTTPNTIGALSQLKGHPLFSADIDLLSSRSVTPLLTVLAFFTDSRYSSQTFADAAAQIESPAASLVSRALQDTLEKGILRIDMSKLKRAIPFPSRKVAHDLYNLIMTLYPTDYNSQLSNRYGCPAKREEGILYYWETLFPHIPIEELFTQPAEILPRTSIWRFVQNGNNPNVNLIAHATKHNPEFTAITWSQYIKAGIVQEQATESDNYKALISAAIQYGCEIPLWQDPMRKGQEEMLYLLDPIGSEQPFLVHASRKLTGELCVTTGYPLSCPRSDIWRTKIEGKAREKKVLDPIKYIDFAYYIWQYSYRRRELGFLTPPEPHTFQKAYLDPVLLYQPQL